MGYYSGSGEVTGGSSTVSVFQHFAWYGAHNVYQKHTTTVNRKGGVSYATARAATAVCDMQTYKFTWGNGSWCWSPNCKGTTVNYQFQQIGGSNLYELVETTDVIQAKLDDQAWVS